MVATVCTFIELPVLTRYAADCLDDGDHAEID